MKAIVIGRHAGELPDIEIVAQESVTFALDLATCNVQIAEIINNAKRNNLDAVIFQNTPGIVAACLVRAACTMSDEWLPVSKNAELKIGVIVSKPGERTAGVSMTFEFQDLANCQEAASAVRFANGRAKIVQDDETDLIVTVDLVTPFVFDHIEWL